MSKATLEINGKKITLELTDEQIKQLTGAEQGRFKPYDGEYFFINSSGRVSDYDWCDDETDHYLYSQRNVFKTAEEAEKEAERRKSLAILQDDAQDWAPDWSDVNQLKYTLTFSHVRKELVIHFHTEMHQLGNIYFETEEIAEKSKNDHEEHWLRVFGVSV